MRGDLLLLPLELIKPQDILVRYSDWIYFTLVLIFFISVAGIAFRKHFERPYVRPLIVVVGLLLTLAVFKNRRVLSLIFESWGTVGSILLVALVAAIPFGLARGFGLSKARALWLTFALIYVIAWIHFSSLFTVLALHNLGFLNLVLLILFIVSLWRVFRFKSNPKTVSQSRLHEWVAEPRDQLEMEREERLERAEIKEVKKEVIPATIRELHSLEELEETLAECQKLILQHPQSLQRDDRDRISTLIEATLEKERLFMESADKLKKIDSATRQG